MTLKKWAAAAVILSCTAATPDRQSDSPLKVYATIKELMDSTVDPAADGIWESVAVVSTEAGIEKREPRTPEEWQEVRRHAVTLLEAMNLVVMSGRNAAPAGAKPGLGELDPRKIDALIHSSRPTFAAFADQVRDTTREALAAIDRKDVEALVVAGGKIDQACESCHATYWYPGAAKP
jgi:hypothetical protein